MNYAPPARNDISLILLEGYTAPSRTALNFVMDEEAVEIQAYGDMESPDLEYFGQAPTQALGGVSIDIPVFQGVGIAAYIAYGRVSGFELYSAASGTAEYVAYGRIESPFFDIRGYDGFQGYFENPDFEFAGVAETYKVALGSYEQDVEYFGTAIVGLVAKGTINSPDISFSGQAYLENDIGCKGQISSLQLDFHGQASLANVATGGVTTDLDFGGQIKSDSTYIIKYRRTWRA